MKKISTLFLAMFLGFWAHSQINLGFCTFVNSQTQECVFENTKFITTPDSTHAKLFMMLRSADVFGTTKLIYKLFTIDRFGNEIYLNSVIQDVQADWMTSWQPAIFNSPGKYIVKVYKDADQMMISKGFEFFNN